MKYLMVIFLLFNVGCATTAKYEEKIKTWMGRSEEDLIKGWGPPDQSYPYSGGKILTYNVARGSHQIANYNQFTNQVYVNSYAVWCKTSFYINAAGLVDNFRLEGNACRSK